MTLCIDSSFVPVHHVCSLCLEWNALGMLDNAFTVFCEGVAANQTLQALDLRNNQISHDSAAELCRALKSNASIRALGISIQNMDKHQHFSYVRLIRFITI